MTMPFHVMPFEKRFLKKLFSPQISSKPPSPQEMEHRKKEKKALRVSKNNGEVNILSEKNTSTSKIVFYVILFFPTPSYHFKNPF
jgi:hypothetical protein